MTFHYFGRYRYGTMTEYQVAWRSQSGSVHLGEVAQRGGQWQWKRLAGSHRGDGFVYKTRDEAAKALRGSVLSSVATVIAQATHKREVLQDERPPT